MTEHSGTVCRHCGDIEKRHSAYMTRCFVNPKNTDSGLRETSFEPAPAAQPRVSVNTQQQSDEAFWKYLDENAETVRRWPGWMRGESGPVAASPAEGPRQTISVDEFAAKASASQREHYALKLAQLRKMIFDIEKIFPDLAAQPSPDAAKVAAEKIAERFPVEPGDFSVNVLVADKPRLYMEEIAAILRRYFPQVSAQFKIALQKIADCDGACQCDHTDSDCCEKVGEFCPHCIAEIALKSEVMQTVPGEARLSRPAATSASSITSGLAGEATQGPRCTKGDPDFGHALCPKHGEKCPPTEGPKYWQCPNNERHFLRFGEKIYGTSHYQQYCIHCPDTKAVFRSKPTVAPAAPEGAAPPDTLTIADYEEVLADHRRLVRELDVLLNGEDGAAKQASLCDIVSQVAHEGLNIAVYLRAVGEVAELRADKESFRLTAKRLGTQLVTKQDELRAAEAQLKAARGALREEIGFKTDGPCQLGVLEYCRCKDCIRKRSVAALGTQSLGTEEGWAEIALRHVTSKTWDDEFIEQQQFESYLGWLISKLETIRGRVTGTQSLGDGEKA